MEPALGFSVAGRDAEGLVIRVYLAPRAMPPCAVDLPVSGAQLIAAADEWTRELDALPPRPWVETH